MAMTCKILIFTALIALVAATSPVKKIDDLISDKSMDIVKKKWGAELIADSKKGLAVLSKKKDDVSDVTTKVLVKSTIKSVLALISKMIKLLDIIGASVVKDKVISSKIGDSWGSSGTQMNRNHGSSNRGNDKFDLKDFGIKAGVSDTFEILELIKDLLKARLFKHA